MPPVPYQTLGAFSIFVAHFSLSSIYSNAGSVRKAGCKNSGLLILSGNVMHAPEMT